MYFFETKMTCHQECVGLAGIKANNQWENDN